MSPLERQHEPERTASAHARAKARPRFLPPGATSQRIAAALSGGPVGIPELVALQRSAGNRAVQRLVSIQRAGGAVQRDDDGDGLTLGEDAIPPELMEELDNHVQIGDGTGGGTADAGPTAPPGARVPRERLQVGMPPKAKKTLDDRFKMVGKWVDKQTVGTYGKQGVHAALTKRIDATDAFSRTVGAATDTGQLEGLRPVVFARRPLEGGKASQYAALGAVSPVVLVRMKVLDDKMKRLQEKFLRKWAQLSGT